MGGYQRPSRGNAATAPHRRGPCLTKKNDPRDGPSPASKPRSGTVWTAPLFATCPACLCRPRHSTRDVGDRFSSFRMVHRVSRWHDMSHAINDLHPLRGKRTDQFSKAWLNYVYPNPPFKQFREKCCGRCRRFYTRSYPCKFAGGNVRLWGPCAYKVAKIAAGWWRGKRNERSPGRKPRRGRPEPAGNSSRWNVALLLTVQGPETMQYNGGPLMTSVKVEGVYYSPSGLRTRCRPSSNTWTSSSITSPRAATWISCSRPLASTPR